ncbi:hypothetical protein [Winogradskya humida]|uniref:Uncharacterized protein n=1 Tax=Winogradskya humida TaxID=113566 RepID=A0ABQ4A756_9ACTN|nr:hypothetical protein [Actinoplanes humidus]GIE26669.1 hypothetical protein Ahu01nite_097710 [Actinoplanes humidus]
MQNPNRLGPWLALLTDEDRYVVDSAKAALDEYGPETQVTISIVRDSAAPTQDSIAVLYRMPASRFTEDVAHEETLDVVDEQGETDHVEIRLKLAQAMAAGLNMAEANQGDFNRSTEMAAAFHELADKLAVYTGKMPVWTWLSFGMGGSHRKLTADAVSAVDQLGTLLIGKAGEPKKGTAGYWDHCVEHETAGIQLKIDADIPAPAEENPDVLRARVAELEAQLAAKAGA